ncbi:MAG: hypothetical protein AAF432_00440 [Planctomycetota bacterium]
MTTDIAQATAAPRPFKMDGKTYLMTPMDFRSFGELDNWIRVRGQELLMPGPDVKGDDRRIAVEYAMRTAAQMKYALSPADFSDAAEMSRRIQASIPCITYMLWLTVRPEHDDVTLEEWTDAIGRYRDPGELMEIFHSLNSPDDAERSEKDSAEGNDDKAEEVSQS